MRRLILPVLLVLCSSGCGGCVGDDSSRSSGSTSQGSNANNPGVIRPGALHVPLRPLVQQLQAAGSATPPGSAAPAAPSAAPSAPAPAPSGAPIP